MSIDAVPNKLLKVTVNGASIATTLYSVTTGGAPCDGLLFGETVTTTRPHLRDDDDTTTVTESQAAITGTLCCATTCSFYDEAGDLSDALVELTEQQPAPLLGWMSYRPASVSASAAAVSAGVGSAAGGGGGPLRPSMRESAVTLALLRRQLALYGGRQALLLLLVTTAADHNGATLTWQFRCFQARLAPASGEMLLDPVELLTLNLGGYTGQAAYVELGAPTALATGSSSAASAPSVAGMQQHAVQISFSASPAVSPAVAQPYGGGDAAAAATAARLAASAREQAKAVQQHCEALLLGLHELCGQAVAGEAAVAALRQRRDALLAQIAAAAARRT